MGALLAGLLRRPTDPRRDHRDAVAGEEPLDLRGRQPAGAAFEGRGEIALASSGRTSSNSGTEPCGRAAIVRTPPLVRRRSRPARGTRTWGPASRVSGGPAAAPPLHEAGQHRDATVDPIEGSADPGGHLVGLLVERGDVDHDHEVDPGRRRRPRGCARSPSPLAEAIMSTGFPVDACGGKKLRSSSTVRRSSSGSEPRSLRTYRRRGSRGHRRSSRSRRDPHAAAAGSPGGP